ncbi:hypothetical protein PIB30_099014, partial [Stylosanthes scabra]|nr:hypothetical protein [Stylosanthes scabra]
MNRQGSSSQEGQVNRGNEATEIIVQASPLRSLRFFNTSSPSDSGSGGNNSETTFLERFGSSNDNRGVSNMMPPTNNNNAASSSLIEVNLNSSPPRLSASSDRLTLQRNNNPVASDIDLTNLGINSNNSNNRQNEVSLDLSLHPSGGEGGSSLGGATEQAGGNGGLAVQNTTAAAAAARRIKRTAPDYPRRELTVGESSSRAAAAAAAAGGGGSVPQAMAAPKRRATGNENAGVHISSSSSSPCTCTPAPTCPTHGGSNNNINNSSSSSSRERHRQTTNNNNNSSNNNGGVVIRGGSSSSPAGPVSELQQAFRSGTTTFQGLQPNNHHHMVTTTTVPSNDIHFNNLINNPELDLMIIDSTIPLLGNHHHHHHVHHGDQLPIPPVTSFYHHGHQCYFATADTPYPPPFGPGPVSTISYLDNLPPHRRFNGSSSSSPPPSPLPWTSVVRPRAIPSLSVTHRRGSGGRGGGSSEANNAIMRINNPSSPPPSYGRGIINYVTQNLGNSPSSSSMVSASSLSNQLLGTLVENAGTPFSGSGAAQNTVGAVPAFQHLSSVARAWIQRLNAHDETLMRASPSSTAAEDPSGSSTTTRQRALRASVAETHNLPTFFADARRLREEIRSAIEHLRSGGSVRLEELLILDYSIVLNLLDTVDEVDEEALEIIEGRRGSNPDIGLTENEILVFIGRETFQTVGEQPQHNDACIICQ